jgi:hypothetical protein
MPLKLAFFATLYITYKHSFDHRINIIITLIRLLYK